MEGDADDMKWPAGVIDLSLSLARACAMITPNFPFGANHEIVAIKLRNRC